MSDTLTLLGYEHKYFEALLSLIDQQLHGMAAGGRVDIELVQSVAEYFSSYPDECHHPVEDMVFRRLCMRQPDAVPDPARLSNEHRDIERLTKSLVAAVATVATGNGVHTSELQETMEKFVDSYRVHMEMEEQHFFSAAAKALAQEDWDEIDFSVFDRDDPLFNPSAQGRFQKLREKIEASAREFGNAALRLKELERVERLGNIDTFNKSLQHKNMVLVPQPQGGYRLESNGNAMIHIPECDEKHAIWCAYFFLQGLARPSVATPG